MKSLVEFEDLMEKCVIEATLGGPEKLTQAMLYAVFPGGGRVRPQLAFGIWASMQRRRDRALMGAAMAVELIHCASLVHDDMPCFDDASMRRGKPSVHREFGEDVALLTGDALIVAAFDVLARFSAHRPEIVSSLVRLLGEAVGASRGIVAGQAAELESEVDVAHVHRLKTGALFEGIAAMTALVAGQDETAWRLIGSRLGMAYQLADDIHDVVGRAEDGGKPTSQDVRNHKPNAVFDRDLVTAARQLHEHIGVAIDAIPEGNGKARLASMLTRFAKRLCPESLVPREISYLYRRADDRAQLGVA